MASAIAAARQQINDVAADGDLEGAAAASEIHLDLGAAADAIELRDGKVVYLRKLHGEQIDKIACALLDMPSRSKFLRAPAFASSRERESATPVLPTQQRAAGRLEALTLLPSSEAVGQSLRQAP